jgi:deferrochelatase/peroxidase EfeB
MSCPFTPSDFSRRRLLAGARGLVASAAVGSFAGATSSEAFAGTAPREGFFGAHQGGIATPQQTHNYFVAFDVIAKTRDEVTTTLRAWTQAAARMTSGETARSIDQDLSVEAPDGGAALGLTPARLTLTFGFGAGLFSKDGALMGFKDGTNNPRVAETTASPDIPRNFDDVVWVGEEGPEWMRGGSYLVARRIRISLEHWDRTEVDFQEQVIGRHKYSGASIGKSNERDPLDLDRQDADGNPLIADNAHVRLGAAASNDGAQILRRAYSYNDGVRFTAERWPPWHQGMMYDAGLLFLAYQRDPRMGFIKIFENMAKLDALNQFTTHTGGGLFACPGGVQENEFIGQRLF